MTTLKEYVHARLPEGYRYFIKDDGWLDVCGQFLEGEPTNESVLTATKKAVEQHGCSIHIDPYELIIDAGICDPKLNLLE